MTDHEDDKLDEVISAFRRMPVPAPPDHSDLLSRLTPAGAGDGRSPSAALRLARSFLMRPAFVICPLPRSSWGPSSGSS